MKGFPLSQDQVAMDIQPRYWLKVLKVEECYLIMTR